MTKNNKLKFLGLCLDQTLSWKTHIENIISIIAKSLYVMNRVKNLLPSNTLKIIYYSLIESYINYGIVVWGNSVHANKLLKLQKRAVRIISKKSYRAHTDPLFKNLQILKVHDLYELNCLLFMTDYLNNKLPNSFQQTHHLNYEMLQRNTRQAQFFYIPRFRTNFSSKQPIVTFPSVFNKYYEDLNLKSIKDKSRKRIKRHLKLFFVNRYQTDIRCHNNQCPDCSYIKLKKFS